MSTLQNGIQFLPNMTDLENSYSGSPILDKDKEWSLKEMLRFAIIAAIIVIPLRLFVAEPYLVRQTSMVPTFQNNDYLVVEKLGYYIKPPERGDVIVFHSPIESGRTLIKRIIGLPGETVEIDGERTFIKKGETTIELFEPYVKLPTPNVSGIYTLGTDEYFMMGDNRAGSYDSRSWGPIHKKAIIGRPIVRLYHFDTARFWPGAELLNNEYPKIGPVEQE